MWALLTILAVVCSADLFGSLPWMDHCFGHHNYEHFACSVELCGSLLWLSILPIQCPALPTPHRKWFMVGNSSGKKFLDWISFSVTVLGNDRLQGLFLLTGLPWNLPATPGIFVGPPTTTDVTTSQDCQLAMSLKCGINY